VVVRVPPVRVPVVVVRRLVDAVVVRRCPAIEAPSNLSDS